MRLLDTKSLRVIEFNADAIPPYAILSHTWGSEEISYHDMLQLEERRDKLSTRFSSAGRVKEKEGFPKVKSAARLAAREGHSYIWIDTCCIDKSSSAELSEAINSMYRWYADASICYAFLADVKPATEELLSEPNSTFRNSRWFTRGWTLQELIAPTLVNFYSMDWTYLGSKLTSSGESGVGAELLSTITGVDSRVLTGSLSPGEVSVADRMSWASLRKTTREEDIAYCLLGIFSVNMPLLYGEGKRAFLRLQEAIMAETDDQSLLAWTDNDAIVESEELCGLLATSPRYFKTFRHIRPLPPLAVGDIVPPSMSSLGLHIQLYLRPIQESWNYIHAGDCYAVLDCSVWENGVEWHPAVILRQLRGFFYARVQTHRPLLVKPPGLVAPVSGEGYQSLYVRQNPIWVLPDVVVCVSSEVHNEQQYYTVKEAYPRSQWDSHSMTFKTAPKDIDSIMGSFRFSDPTGESGDVGVAIGLRRETHYKGQLRSWAFQRPLPNDQTIRGFHTANKDLLTTVGASMDPTMLGMDDRLSSQTTVREVTRHGRSYIYLQVTKRYEIGTNEPAVRSKALRHTNSPVAGLIIPTSIQERLGELIQPKCAQDFTIMSIFDDRHVLSKRVRICPSSLLSSFKIEMHDDAYGHRFLMKMAPKKITYHDDAKGTSMLREGLFEACQRGQHLKVAKIMSQGNVSPEAQANNFHGLRPLHLAALYNFTSVAKALLEAGADLHSTASGRVTPLHIAALMGHVDIIKLFLSEQWTQKFPRQTLLQAQTYNYLETPLHLAATSDNCTDEILNLLSFANDYARDDNSGVIMTLNLLQEQPIDRAASWNNIAAFKFFLPFYTYSHRHYRRSSGNPPLLQATLGNSPEIVRLLGESKQCAPSWADENGRTALYEACLEGHAGVLAALFEIGAAIPPSLIRLDVDAFIGPIHVAALLGHHEALEVLLSNGGDANQKIEKTTHRKVLIGQPLHLAAAQGHLECVKVLCRKGADVQSLGVVSFKVKVEGGVTSAGVREQTVKITDWWEWRPPITPASMALASGHNETATWLQNEEDSSDQQGVGGATANRGNTGIELDSNIGEDRLQALALGSPGQAR